MPRLHHTSSPPPHTLFEQMESVQLRKALAGHRSPRVGRIPGLLVSTALLVLCAVSADAQQQRDPRGLAPPAYSAVDENRVDLASGRYSLEREWPKIGSGSSSLSYQQFFFAEAGTPDNFSGRIEQASSSIPNAQQFTVNFAKTTAVFQLLAGGTMQLWRGQGGESLRFINGSNQLAVFTDRDGTEIMYDLKAGNPNRWYPILVTRPDGEKLTLEYVPGISFAVLRSVVSTLGYQLHFERDSAQLLSRVVASNQAVDFCDPTAPTCAYSLNWPSASFSADGSVTDNAGRRIQVSRASSFAADVITAQGTLTGGRTTSLGFGSANAPGDFTDGNWNYGRVTSLSDGKGSWSYTYKTQTRLAANPDSNATNAYLKTIYTTRTNPLGKTLSTISYNGGLVSRTDELGRTMQINRKQTDSWSEGRVESVVMPEGNRTEYGYDGRGNVISVKQFPKPGSLLSTTEATASYPATCSNVRTCNQPDYVIDARGGRTDYTYYDWGGLKSEAGPSVSGSRSLTMYSYTQVSALMKQANGSSSNGLPVWRISEKRVCKTALNAAQDGCISAQDEIVTRYEYGSSGSFDSILLKGIVQDASGTPRRTCYRYNYVGNLIAEIKPRAGLSACS